MKPLSCGAEVGAANADRAQLRLAHSRAEIVRWLEAGIAPLAPSPMQFAWRNVLPLIGSLQARPGWTTMLLAPLLQAWLQPRKPEPAHGLDAEEPATRRFRAPPFTRVALFAAGVAGLALLLWRRSAARHPPHP